MKYGYNYLICIHFFLTRSLAHRGNPTQRIPSTRSMLSVDINQPDRDGQHTFGESQRFLSAFGYVSCLVNPYPMN